MNEICEDCEFELASPVAELKISFVGLYSDARFRGRCIVSLRSHYEGFETLEREVLLGFMKDIQKAVAVIEKVTGSTRVNIAILCDDFPHIHAHLIPRYPDEEEFPHKSPWDDGRTLVALNDADKRALMKDLKHAFDE